MRCSLRPAHVRVDPVKRRRGEHGIERPDDRRPRSGRDGSEPRHPRRRAAPRTRSCWRPDRPHRPGDRAPRAARLPVLHPDLEHARARGKTASLDRPLDQLAGYPERTRSYLGDSVEYLRPNSRHERSADTPKPYGDDSGSDGAEGPATAGPPVDMDEPASAVDEPATTRTRPSWRGRRNARAPRPRGRSRSRRRCSSRCRAACHSAPRCCGAGRSRDRQGS